jgi:hypothetical protein
MLVVLLMLLLMMMLKPCASWQAIVFRLVSAMIDIVPLHKFRDWESWSTPCVSCPTVPCERDSKRMQHFSVVFTATPDMPVPGSGPQPFFGRRPDAFNIGQEMRRHVPLILIEQRRHDDDDDDDDTQ